MSHILFVGERRSKTAKERGWTWKDGHLAAKQLFDAFKVAGFPVYNAEFCNVFERGPDGCEAVIRAIKCNKPIVAMGRKVQKALDHWGIEYTPMVHPAARGTIRGKHRYAQHVAATLKKTRCAW